MKSKKIVKIDIVKIDIVKQDIVNLCPKSDYTFHYVQYVFDLVLGKDIFFSIINSIFYAFC